MHFTKTDYKMFDLAHRAAEQSDFGPFKLGAVIAYKGQVISTGFNQRKSHPMQKKYNRKYRHFKKGKKGPTDSLHAEMDSILNIPRSVMYNIDITKCHIYIYRICKGKPLGYGDAFCCEACRHALMDLGIKHVYYTTDHGFSYTRLEG